jgi:alkylated DNA repair dioxygenase AlkB
VILPINEAKRDLDISSQSNTIKVPGLNYIHDYINTEKQNYLLGLVDQQEWSTKSKRRVQHYGYQYDYHNGLLASSSYLGTLPNWLQSIVEQLFSDRLTAKVPDQVIINEYEPGQGIADHFDCVPCFGKTIISLSLGSPCVMNFTHSHSSAKLPIFLSPGSLIVMQDAARYDWQHGIAARKKDNYKDREYLRTRRVSLTFREVLFPYK